MKIIAFAGSSSTQSINKKLVTFAASLFEGNEIEILDLNDFEVPIYSIDKENKTGIPEKIKTFSDKLSSSDLILLSLAEHNGAYSSSFKNVFDWSSRISDSSVFHGKPILLMATSPGGRGGSSVLDIAKNRFQYNGGKILDTFSLPSFYDNFSEKEGLKNEELRNQLIEKVNRIKQSM